MKKDQLIMQNRHGDIAVLLFNRAPVNALSAEFRTVLHTALAELLQDASVSAIICTSNELPFSAGADIKEFTTPLGGKDFVDLYRLMVAAKKPIIAAIRQYALGGGLEFAMLCHHRVLMDDAYLAQPEIKLGIFPGGTGTQTLPRLVGVQKALQMILTGRSIKAQQALDDGLVDAICHVDLLQEALTFTRKKLTDPDYVLSPPILRAVNAVDADYFSKLESELASRAYGFRAPQLALQCVHASLTMPVEQAVEYEQKQFMQLLTGPDCAAMRYMFFAQHRCTTVALDKDKLVSIESVGIVGGGLMGSGIATAVLYAGYKVVLVEQDESRITSCLQRIEANLSSWEKRAKISATQKQLLLSNLQVKVDLQSLSQCDLVIEAVFEDMALKQSLFRELDKILSVDAIIATNTSSLDVNVLSAQVNNPGRVCGLHFFSPAQVMRLLEVVRADSTSNVVLATVKNFARRIKKIPVVVGVCPGFVGNRMLVAYFRQVELILLQGISPERIDKALCDFGFAMGPCAMADMAGLDISSSLFDQDNLAKYLVSQGRLGQKSLAGFYDYTRNNNQPSSSPEAAGIIAKYAKVNKVNPGVYTDAEIVQRCLFALVLEACHIMQAGLVARASDIDVIYVYGYGFPSYRGGPIFYADSLGLKFVATEIANYRQQQPDSWQESALFTEYAQSAKALSQYKRAD